MARRALPALLLAAAALADGVGHQRLALYALLAAVPALTVSGLSALGDVLDGQAGASRQLQALLSGIGLLLVVGGAAVRSPAVDDAGLPPLAVTALVAALGVLALEAAVGAGRAAVERPARRRLRRTVQPDELSEAA